MSSIYNKSHATCFGENAKGSPYNILLAFSHFYVENDLRKNKIVVASTTGFLGISTKIEVLALNLGLSNLFWVITSLKG